MNGNLGIKTKDNFIKTRSLQESLKEVLVTQENQ